MANVLYLFIASVFITTTSLCLTKSTGAFFCRRKSFITKVWFYTKQTIPSYEKGNNTLLAILDMK